MTSILLPSEMTRRRAIQLGLAAAASMAPRQRSVSLAAAQATPGTSHYAHLEQLQEATDLAARIDDPAMRVVALTPADAFGKGHIPGAAQVDWDALNLARSDEASVNAWGEAMTALMAQLGIGTNTQVVTYDDATLFAARLWWVLRFLGHEQVSVLNGGLAAWQAAGGEIGASPAEIAASATPASANPAAWRRDILATLDDVKASLNHANVAIVDARSPEEYAKGHIPGAVNIPYPRNATAEPPLYWLPQDELLAMYAQAGVTPDKRVIPYCSTGVRSAVTAFTLSLIGYEHVILFSTSWAEWTEGERG